MTKKVKLSDIGKDLDIPCQKIIDFVAEFSQEKKKNTSALKEEEVNIILEHFSQLNQVADFEVYFKSKNTPKTDMSDKLKQDNLTIIKINDNLENNNVIDNQTQNAKEVNKDSIAKGEHMDKNNNTTNNDEKNKQVSQTPQADTPKTQSTPAPTQDNNTSGERKFQNNNNGYSRPQGQNNNGYSRPQGQNNNGYSRPQGQNNNGYSRPQGQNNNGYSRPQGQNNNGYSRPQGQNNNGGGYSRPQGQNNNGYSRPQGQNNNGGFRSNNNNRNDNGRPNYQNNNYRNNNSQPIAPKTPKLPVRQPIDPNVPTEKVVRTVDTRGSYVELDKYNERYEQMAGPQNPKHNKDNYSKKQKLNQRSAQRNRQQFSNKKETEADKMRRLELERARKQQLKVMIPDVIIVSELASRLKVTATQVIKKLMGLGIMASINEEVDFDTATLVAEEFGAKVEKEVIVTIEERLIDDSDDDDNNQEERSPVVVVMGHVDHGKTSLLDHIRNANVTASEAGGITQHIGAYRVKVQNKDITFLDTPGHEAFTSMRARGASITDIAILVVAADDGIMPQTIEAINHAKAAEVAIIVAINKMDKEGANPDKVKQSLTEYGLVPEEWGGDVICVPVSAKTGEGIDDLLENVLLVAEMRELKANPNRLAKGAVIEARMDTGRGPIATILVQNGTLHQGDVIIAGTAVGKIRVMTNDKGKEVSEAGPSVPVEITGLAEVPSAGDTFNAVEDERLARTLVEQRKHEAKQEQFNAYQNITLDNLFSQIAEGEIKELPIIVKADVQGSVEAVKQSLEKLSNEEVRVKVIHGGVGAVSESDVMLASASNAIIVGFNVRPDPVASENAHRDGVDIRLYRIIYDAIEEISTAMKGMLAPKFRENLMGRIEVRQVYKITNVGLVSGCYVLDGKVTRACQIRVVRDGIVIAEDKIDSLKRFKDDVKEVAQSYECGISLDKFSDIKEGDIFEAFIMEEYKED